MTQPEKVNYPYGGSYVPESSGKSKSDSSDKQEDLNVFSSLNNSDYQQLLGPFGDPLDDVFGMSSTMGCGKTDFMSMCRMQYSMLDEMFTPRAGTAGSVGNIEDSNFQPRHYNRVNRNYSGKGLGIESEYSDMITKIAREEGMDPALIKSIVKAESSFDPNAKSSCGARGLMQLMPKTAAEVIDRNKDKLGFDKKHFDINNPEQNIKVGTLYFAEQMKTFKGDIGLALAAYNAGPGAVIKNDYNIPPYKETQDYVKKIMGYSGYKSESQTA